MTSLTEDCKHTPGPNDPLLNDIARKRIDQYTKTAAIKYELLYTECSAFIYNGVLQTFNDKQVHEILRRSGIRRPEFSNSHFGTEWYETDLDTVKKAIAAAKEGRTCLSPDEKTQNVPAPIVFRPEQRAAIDMAVKRFTKKGGSGSRQVLWNCKMRFGKTLSALQVVREINAQRTLIVTHRPVVNADGTKTLRKSSMIAARPRRSPPPQRRPAVRNTTNSRQDSTTVRPPKASRSPNCSDKPKKACTSSVLPPCKTCADRKQWADSTKRTTTSSPPNGICSSSTKSANRLPRS